MPTLRQLAPLLTLGIGLFTACAQIGGRAMPAKRVSIADTGAVADGRTLNTKPIQAAIDNLAENGGGVLVIPKGVFLSGAIFLKPGVNLHLDEGAVLKGSPDAADYPTMLTRIEGHFEPWLPALVNADHCDRLRITGAGTLDGNGAPFWNEFRTRYAADKTTRNLDVPRPRLVFVRESRDVGIGGVTFKDSGFWNLHLYRCQEVVVENVRFEVPDGARCPSTDGTDIDSSQNVTIRGCTYRVDDDSVCLKGTKGPFALDDEDSPPVENIRVEHCTFERGHGAVTLGSEATVVRHVTVENCVVTGHMPLVRLKFRPDTPQRYEDVHYRNITLARKGGDRGGQIFEARPWTQYFDLKGQPPPKSVVRNITLSHITGSFGGFGEIQGNPGQTDIGDFVLEDIDLQLKTPELVAPEVKNLVFKNVRVNGRPASAPLTP